MSEKEKRKEKGQEKSYSSYLWFAIVFPIIFLLGLALILFFTRADVNHDLDLTATSVVSTNQVVMTQNAATQAQVLLDFQATQTREVISTPSQ